MSPWNACTYVQTLDIIRVHCADRMSPEAIARVMGGTMATLLETRRPVAA